MKFWPFTRKAKPAIRPLSIQLVKRDVFNLSLSEYRADERMVNGAALVFRNEFMQVMFQVLKNEHVAFQVMHPGMPLEQRALQQARIEGYTLALSNLEAMATKPQESQTIEATFEAEKEEPPTE